MAGETNAFDIFDNSFTAPKFSFDSAASFVGQLKLLSKLGNFNLCKELLFQQGWWQLSSANDEDSNTTNNNNIVGLIDFIIEIYEAYCKDLNLWQVHQLATQFRARIFATNNRLKNNEEENVDDSSTTTDRLQRLECVTDINYTEFYLTCSSIPSYNSIIQCHDLIYLYNHISNLRTIEDGSTIITSTLDLEQDEKLQPIMIKLRNTLFHNTPVAEHIINIFLKLAQPIFEQQNVTNGFGQLYRQALIHSLKNQNQRRSTADILLSCPDVILDDDNLVCQIIDYFCQPEDGELGHDELEARLYLLYSIGMFRSSTKLVRLFDTINRTRPKYLAKADLFSEKQFFLLAAYRHEHFLSQLQRAYDTGDVDIGGHLSSKAQIMLNCLRLYELVNNNNNTNRTEGGKLLYDRLTRLEAKLANVMLNYENENLVDDDQDMWFQRFVEKIKFVFRYTQWFLTSPELTDGNSGGHENVINTYNNLIISLLSGSSPTKLLVQFGFLELRPKHLSDGGAIRDEEKMCDNLCQLVAQFDTTEAAILRGFFILKFILICILSNESDHHIEIGHVQTLLQDIYPIDFRMEIMENLFSFLFLTKNDIFSDKAFATSSDDDYLDETLRNASSARRRPSHQIREFIPTIAKRKNDTTFICPNWIIPRLLTILKDCLYKTSSDIYTHTTSGIDVGHRLNSPGGLPFISFGVDTIESVKSRLTLLKKYVTEAQFRYDVIKPAFYQNLAIVSGTNCQQLPTTEIIVEDKVSPNEVVSNTSSDNELKSGVDLGSTSLVSCMLASNTQLLCYTLIENRLDNSKQIVRLFFDDLCNSKEFRELQMLELFAEMHGKVCNIQAQFAKSSSSSITPSNIEDSGGSKLIKIGDIANSGLKTSRIQSLIYETLLKMDKMDNLTKKVFMLDYALSSSPSLEIGHAILESIRTQADLEKTARRLPDRVEHFIGGLQATIDELAQHLNTRQMSMIDFLEKQLTLSNFEAGAFVELLSFEMELKQVYHEFFSHLNSLENKVIHDMSAVVNSEPEDSELFDSLYTKLVKYTSFSKCNYLKHLCQYVKKVSKALIECKRRNLAENKDATTPIHLPSHFSILKQSPSAILCSMVIKSKMSPEIIDDLASMMKVNLIAVLCSVYCPTIPTTFVHTCEVDFLVTELCYPALSDLIETYFKGVEQCQAKSQNINFASANYFSEEAINMTDQQTSFQPLINGEVLNYFNSKCTILVQLLHMLNLINDTQVAAITRSASSVTTSPFNLRLVKDDHHQPATITTSPLMRWVDLIRRNFTGGDLTSSTSLAFYPRIVPGHSVVMKTFEYHSVHHNYLQVYNLFKFIENLDGDDEDRRRRQRHQSFLQEKSCNSYDIMRNAVYSRLVFVQENAKYVFHIVKSPTMKADLVLSLLTTSEKYDETFIATRLVRLCLQTIEEDEVAYDLDASECKEKLESFLCEIEFYAAVGQLTGLKTWKLAKENLSSIDMLTIMKTKKRYRLAIDWYRINGLEMDTCELHLELLIYAYSELNDYVSLRKLFQKFIAETKANSVINVVEKTLAQVNNLELRTFLVDFLAHFNRKRLDLLQVESYEQYRLGIEIVKLLSIKIRDDYLGLISKPSLLVEQLLMNGEIESLEKIINQYHLIRVDDLVEKYALKAVYIELYETNSFSGSDITMLSSEYSSELSKSFVIPEKIPSKEQWVSDTAETHCMLCQIVRFSMLYRRHHCRRCGRVVCSNCSPNSFIIPEISTNSPVRVCNDCFSHLKHYQRKASIGSIDSNGSHHSNYKRTNWRLTANDVVANELRRSEFGYEASPSVTLCLAILRLHSNKKKSCKFIIETICTPLLESIASNNVDSPLLIEIIRSLLISARVLGEDSENHLNEIELLDLYLDRLDVIRMLINSNVGTKETIGHVLHNNIQRLQEMLLEMERFELALDIAKKYGLGSSSIWKSWSLICLKNLQFIEARKKFARYFDMISRATERQHTLKAIVDTLVSKNNLNNNSHLHTIMAKDKCAQILAGNFDYLRGGQQQQPTPTTSTASNVYMTTTTASSAKTFNDSNSQQHLKPRIFEEIVYYLREYGTFEDLLRFYVRYTYWREAVGLLVAHKATSASVAANIGKLFLQELFVPAQHRACLAALFAAIRTLDPTLAEIWPALLGACKYLDKENASHTLYRLQLFMNDYLRATITQINFFLDKTSSLEQRDEVNSFGCLYSRLAHLEKARDHCNMFLHTAETSNVRPGCLVIDKKKILKQIKLIELQIEVLKRLHTKQVTFPVSVLSLPTEEIETTLANNIDKLTPTWRVAHLVAVHALRSLPTSGGDDGDKRPADDSHLSLKTTEWLLPPTLLENDIDRKCLITSLIILHFGANIEEGFRCSLSIIQEHELDAQLVFKFTGFFILLAAFERTPTTVGGGGGNGNQHTIDQLGQLLACVRSYFSNDNKETTTTRPELTRSTSNKSTGHRSAGQRPAEKETNANKEQHDAARMCDNIVNVCIALVDGILRLRGVLLSSRANTTTTATNSVRLLETHFGLAVSRLNELKEQLIKSLSDDHNRIEAYIGAGRLKLAYLLSVSLGEPSNVRRVLDAAKVAGDVNYVKICEMWLRQNVRSG